MRYSVIALLLPALFCSIPFKARGDTVPPVRAANNGTLLPFRPTLNFIGASPVDNPTSNRIDITVSASCTTCLYSGTDVAVQSVTVTQNDGGTAQRAAVYARNLTPATASATVQQPGCYEFEGQAFGGDGGSVAQKAAICWVPEAGASKGATGGHWLFKTQVAGGAWVDVAQIAGKTGALTASPSGMYLGPDTSGGLTGMAGLPSVGGGPLGVFVNTGDVSVCAQYWGAGPCYKWASDSGRWIPSTNGLTPLGDDTHAWGGTYSSFFKFKSNAGSAALTCSTLADRGNTRQSFGSSVDGGTGLRDGVQCCNKTSADGVAWGACSNSLREIAAAGRASSYSSTHTVAGAFAFSADEYRLGTTAPTLTFRSVAAMGAAGVSGYVLLYNASDGETVATQTITSTSTTATDSTLTVGLGAGNVKPTSKVYEVHVYTAPVDGGTTSDTVELYSANLRVSN